MFLRNVASYSANDLNPIILSTLMMETSVFATAIQLHILEDGIRHRYLRETSNLT
jgi:hypothetical protein